MKKERRWILITLLGAVLFLSGCDKSTLNPENEEIENDPFKILVDASHDGGVWWYPIANGEFFDPNKPHQGKMLADYLRSLGFEVDELPRGTTVTSTLLNGYDNVIRAGKSGYYSEAELQAYENFLKRETSLVLISEYLRPGNHDQLAERLGIPFIGIAKGCVLKFADHPITTEVNPFYYNAGSVVLDAASNPSIEVLGWLSDETPGSFNSEDFCSFSGSTFVDLDDDDVRDSNEPTEAAVMGVLHHPTAKIFFIGEMNCIEQVPQPLIDNLIQWAFTESNYQ